MEVVIDLTVSFDISESFGQSFLNSVRGGLFRCRFFCKKFHYFSFWLLLSSIVL